MALKMLGNAVVPAQAEPIFAWIAKYETTFAEASGGLDQEE